ncbi:hypothetical protein C772_01417 [Bhargavaea cecembensis DSE10]|uniref:Uncharacterized protein n=1 Tax=Bhargavaea cecembensis DSE10 TaxID=1235279 RepID=M7NGY8_9BACL|nr:hypothetical protein C772_01417 [Bhargavaea cecembensis DSE10]
MMKASLSISAVFVFPKGALALPKEAFTSEKEALAKASSRPLSI